MSFIFKPFYSGQCINIPPPRRSFLKCAVFTNVFRVNVDVVINIHFTTYKRWIPPNQRGRVWKNDTKVWRENTRINGAAARQTPRRPRTAESVRGRRDGENKRSFLQETRSKTRQFARLRVWDLEQEVVYWLIDLLTYLFVLWAERCWRSGSDGPLLAAVVAHVQPSHL